MARITVEDCLEKIGDDNRFSLVHLAVERVKQRRQGLPLLIAPRKNKEVVMALREIAAGAVTFNNIIDLPNLQELHKPSETAGNDESEKQTAKEAA